MEIKNNFAQFIWTGLEGTSLTQDEKNFLSSTPPAGVILFSKNYESPEQVFELNKELQSIATSNGLKVPFFIGIDMEGGRVARLKEPFTIWPPMQKVAEKDSTSNAFELAKALGTELKAVGINFDFSPCTDTLLNPQNQVIGDRSFGSDPDTVGKFASSIIRGLKKADILTCTKHFPGHGYSEIDSHDALPVDDRTLEEIQDIEAFKKALRSKADFIMPGHIKFPKVDPEYPVTLSQKWISDILINDMNCRALLISDDLEMGALKDFEFDFMVKRVYDLGFHQLLFCHGHTKAQEALEILAKTSKVDHDRLSQILDVKAGAELIGPSKFDSNLIGHDEHKKIAQEFA